MGEQKTSEGGFLMKRRNVKVRKYGFIKRMEKEAMVGLCAVSFMMLTTGFD